MVLEIVEVAENNGLKLPREFGLLLKQVSRDVITHSIYTMPYIAMSPKEDVFLRTFLTSFVT